jgi:hypothetical protein
LFPKRGLFRSPVLLEVGASPISHLMLNSQLKVPFQLLENIPELRPLFSGPKAQNVVIPQVFRLQSAQRHCTFWYSFQSHLSIKVLFMMRLLRMPSPPSSLCLHIVSQSTM